MPISLSPDAIADIRSLVDQACTNEHARLPCASVVVLGKDEESAPVELLVGSACPNGPETANSPSKGNTRQSPSQSKPGNDNIYWLASCTKLVTGIACMQLVEEGKLRLDDSSQVEEICPELAMVKVLQDDGSLVDKERSITLRMLLTHTGRSGSSWSEIPLHH